tara:strand:+ start:8329 stop:8811 length:483 start_codon:yes stop_codon:yes gene_type:complete
MQKSDKKEILKSFIKDLEDSYELLAKLAHEAKEHATDEDSAAENKYDTRGLESSYLAGAQSLRAKEFQEAIYYYKRINTELASKSIVVGSLVHVKIDDKDKFFFIVPVKGGLTISFNDIEIQSLSSSSPLGSRLLGKQSEDVFEWQQGENELECEILRVL